MTSVINKQNLNIYKFLMSVINYTSHWLSIHYFLDCRFFTYTDLCNSDFHRATFLFSVTSQPADDRRS